MQPYAPILDLARAYLARYLTMNADRRRARGSASQLGVREDEVLLALEPPPAPTPLADSTGPAISAFSASLEQGSPLGRLRDVFALHPLDLAILAVLLAPELDHELERAFTFALDDFTRKRPDVAFVCRLIGANDPFLVERVLARFDEAAPLRRHGLIALAAQGESAASMRTVRTADRIVAYVRGHDTIDELVRGCVKLPRFRPARAQIVMDPALVERIARAVLVPTARVLLAGPNGVGRATVTEVVFGERDRDVVRVDLEALITDGPRIAERVAASVREAALRDAAIVFEGGELDREVPRALAQAIYDASIDLAVPMVFALRGHPGWLVNAVANLVELDIPLPTFRERLELWGRALPAPLVDPPDLDVVASRYSFAAGTIAGAARRAESTARLRDPDAPKVTLDDLGTAARLTFSHRLGEMAQRIPIGFTWNDLVLPTDTMDAVKEVVRFARFRPFLLEDWGFAAKLPYGRGVSAILAGPPGTGKTMVAQILAHELGYDLYRIDLSQVVNKYIGETEKNLGRIFDEAETSHAVLFFDEADALFAKRTEVKSSNDRYANLEVNYLLQRMETFDGVTLLATNLEQGLDDAFKRRVRFSIQFELPDEDVRARLWKSMFPPKVPLEPEIDWTTIAKRFEMAGGYIKKAVLRAALIAASEGRPVSTTDILEAARQEYREMGRIV
ncbi:MAG: ATP-binding protein [Proteobacteria bacterium]|nr:ATP-binding protein [Pseudomonadota bacterium]